MGDHADGVIVRRPPPASFRLDRRALAEGADLVLIVAFLLVYIWIIEPRTQAYAWHAFALFLAFTVLSSRRHGDTRADLGIRLDTFRRALAEAAVVFSPALLLTLAIGLFFRSGSHVTIRHITLSLLGGYPWALFQQYGLQWFISPPRPVLFPPAPAPDPLSPPTFAARTSPTRFLPRP